MNNWSIGANPNQPQRSPKLRRAWEWFTRPRATISRLAILVSVMLAPGTALANTTDLDNFNSKYGTGATSLNACSLCHTSAPSLNSYGSAYKNAGRNPAAFGAIEPDDSDGDGFTNLVEIQALTFPGDAASFPATVRGVTAVARLGVDAKSGLAGTTVTYTIDVTNTGNTSDNFAVSVTGAPAWNTVPGTVGALGSQGSTSFVVQVSVPASATAGQSDVATIKVTSTNDDTKFSTVTLTTTAGAPPLPPPPAIATPTLSDWMTGVLALLLAVGGWLALRRRGA